MAFSLHGVHVPHRKHTAGMDAVRMDAPKTVTIPMSMHIGKPATPVVKVGDMVCVGTLIAEQSGFVSAPIHSSVSGKVTKLTEILTYGGTTVPAIQIESDGLMTPDPALAPKEIGSADELIDAMRDCGLVGLGGAGFPTYVKYKVEKEKIQELVVNGAECEPYITSDSYTMEKRSEDIALALELMEKHLGIKKIIIGIESNKAKSIESMQALAAKDSNVQVKVLPAMYPQGGEKVLIYHTTGKSVPLGKLPIDVGCIVANVTSLAVLGQYVRTGMPLVEKCVTVDGAAVHEPKNVIAPIGTSMDDLFAFCGGLDSEPAKVLYGGPMMGISVPDTASPVLKTTNAVLALNKKEAALPETTPCIRCGTCTNTCPFGMAPASILKAYEKKDFEALDKLKVDLCMECGCCSYVCPASQPLTQTNRLAKAALKEYKAKEEKK
ncbi:MAG: electron transport complex subunit RsxC [Lachnospiraceae bacterium]|nr:electron transport complex subunit RsxC [Lachnospiraceae bacterium]